MAQVRVLDSFNFCGYAAVPREGYCTLYADGETEAENQGNVIRRKAVWQKFLQGWEMAINGRVPLRGIWALDNNVRGQLTE